MVRSVSLPPQRRDGRVILHFDYDCFYAAVFEREDPTLRHVPLAVQQKQIIVTCNYEARRRGLHKLQLVAEARKQCPELIIVLGEDLTRFRNASKDNYNFLKQYPWSRRLERLGFDEVFVDVTDMVDYNHVLLNPHALQTSFFHLSREDPTVGFEFDGRDISGHVWPPDHRAPEISKQDNPQVPDLEAQSDLYTRLMLGSHFAHYLRHQLEEQKGFSSTVGVSTTKLISKLVGNVNKPKRQTTLVPPYPCFSAADQSNITRFLDVHDIGSIPGIGFKSAQKIRNHILGRPAAFDGGLVYGGTREQVMVKDVRLAPGMGPELLESLLGGPGAPKWIGTKAWSLINGVDDSEVCKAREVPQQISIEDSYLKLDTVEEVETQLKLLSRSLIYRMRIDLACEDEESLLPGHEESIRWLAHPRTLRLTTRPRAPLSSDGTRARTFKRISKSCDMPSMVFGVNHNIEILAERLVKETLLPLFRKLHPGKANWNLSLINLCAANMSPSAFDTRGGTGRDISRMFRDQDTVLKDWKIQDPDVAPSQTGIETLDHDKNEACNIPHSTASGPRLEEMTQTHDEGTPFWNGDKAKPGHDQTCSICGSVLPKFAMVAHERFHSLPD